MSYIQQLYLQKKKEMEDEAMKNRHIDGIQARFVANKIIKMYFQEFNKNDLSLTLNRLNRLVELVDLNYRKNHQGKALYNDGYIVSVNGLAVPYLLYHYEFLLKDEDQAKNYFERKEKEYQVNSESVIDEKLNKEIDYLVGLVLHGTRYLDTVDLRDMLNSEKLQQFKFDCVEYEFEKIPQEIVTELFYDFNFEEFLCLNEKEKERLGV